MSFSGIDCWWKQGIFKGGTVMSPGGHSDRSSGPAIVAVILLLAPLVYVLSIGPVVAIVERTGVGRELVRALSEQMWRGIGSDEDAPDR